MLEEVKKTPLKEAKKTLPIEEESDPTTQPKSTSEGEQHNMSYPYPKYNYELDAEAHVRTFLTTWQENHVSQHLAEPEPEKSKIAEFGLLLDDQASG